MCYSKWLRFAKTITVRLAYISWVFLNGSKIIQLLFSKSCVLVNCLKQKLYIAIRKKIILKYFIYILFLKTILYFLMLMITWQFHLPNLQGEGPIWAISISFVYTRLVVGTFPKSHKLNLTYYLKSSLTHIFREDFPHSHLHCLSFLKIINILTSFFIFLQYICKENSGNAANQTV